MNPSDKYEQIKDIKRLNPVELEAMVLKHEQQIKDIAEHLLELRKWGSPMMEFKQEKPTMGMEYAANFEKAEKLLEKKEWVGLTEEEISAVDWKSNETLHDFARAIETKLKDKNT